MSEDNKGCRRAARTHNHLRSCLFTPPYTPLPPPPPPFNWRYKLPLKHTHTRALNPFSQLQIPTGSRSKSPRKGDLSITCGNNTRSWYTFSFSPRPVLTICLKYVCAIRPRGLCGKIWLISRLLCPALRERRGRWLEEAKPDFSQMENQICGLGIN